MPVVSRISVVTSESASISFAVAISVPSRTKMPGFSVPVTTSTDSPSRPIEVSPSTRPGGFSASSRFSTVVLPAFLHMPTMDSVFTSVQLFGIVPRIALLLSAYSDSLSYHIRVEKETPENRGGRAEY